MRLQRTSSRLAQHEHNWSYASASVITMATGKQNERLCLAFNAGTIVSASNLTCTFTLNATNCSRTVTLSATNPSRIATNPSCNVTGTVNVGLGTGEGKICSDVMLCSCVQV